MSASRFCSLLLLVAILPLASCSDDRTITLGFGFVIGDLNSDNKEDLSTANRSSKIRYSSIDESRRQTLTGSTTIILQTADGAQVTGRFEVGRNPIGIDIGDVDGDGVPDLILANEDFENNVTILLQNASARGTFRFLANLSITDFVPGSFATVVSVGDLNNDSLLDIAVATIDTGIAVFFQTDAGAFMPSVWVIDSGNSVQVADLNADGFNDLALTREGLVSVLLQDPATPGTFQAADDYPTASRAVHVVAEDVDADGKPDLVVANRGPVATPPSGSISVLIQDPGNAGKFQAATDFVTDGIPTWVDTGDLDADGKVDIASSDATNGLLIMIADATEASGFRAPERLSLAEGTLSVGIGDFDSDGNLDAAVLPNPPGTGILLLIQDGNGGLKPPIRVEI